MKSLLPAAITGALLLTLANPVSAAIEPRSILKTFFETGDVPTEEQFKDLIDSFLNYNDDGLTVYALGTSSGAATKKYVDDTVGALDNFTVMGPGVPIPAMAPNFAGSAGFLPVVFSSSAGNHFGYFQLSMDDPLLVDPAGIHVDYFAYNATPNESLTVTAVPEPASLALLALAVPLMLRRRRNV